MSDVVTDVSKLNGFFKKKYASKVAELIPDNAKFTGRLEFSKAERIGDSYNMPVELALEQGISYAGAGAGAFTLEDAVAGEMKNASLDGTQYLIKGILDYESAAKATAEGEEAFGNAGARLVKRMTKSIYKRIELAALYGQSLNGLGILGSTPTSSVSGATGNILFTTASWATGIWAGMRNAKLDLWNGSSFSYSTPSGKRNATGVVTINSVNVGSRLLNVTFTGGSGSTEIGNLAAGDIVTFGSATAPSAGSAMAAQMVGLDVIATNSGTLFGINGATYELFAGNTYDAASGPLTLGKLNTAISAAVGKGLDEKATVFVSHVTWGNLANDQAALRRYDGKVERAENGFRSITFFSQNGELEIVPHTMVKEGEAFIVPLDRFKKIGATDVTFQTPGRSKDEFFRQVDGKAGYELRAYANLALFCEAPGLCTKIINIVNS